MLQVIKIILKFFKLKKSKKIVSEDSDFFTEFLWKKNTKFRLICLKMLFIKSKLAAVLLYLTGNCKAGFILLYPLQRFATR